MFGSTPESGLACLKLVVLSQKKKKKQAGRRVLILVNPNRGSQ